ncbi:MAG: hypothetical protein CMC82_00435 [Flavobacteriaceae bacterium]|nr:hypothetical protein [Flavobacteriaceae bacterium]
MTEHIQDPCLELEETTEESEEGASAPPPSQNRLEAPRAAFPVRLPERVDELILRESSIINQQFFVSSQLSNKIRFPNQAYLLPEWSQLSQSTIDTFRYISGKNFLYDSDTNIQIFNPGNSVNADLGVPYSFEYSSILTARVEDVNVKLIFDKQVVETVASDSVLFSTSEDVDEFLHYYINAEVLSPFATARPHALIPTENKFEDIFFTAPAAFYETEVQQSVLPMIEFVSIIPVVGKLPIDESGVESSKQSLYRLYANINVDSEAPLKFSNDILQKYSSNQVNLIGNINTEASSVVVNSQFYEEAKETINTHIKISLNLNHKSDVAGLFKEYGLDSVLLDFLSSDAIEVSSIPKLVQVLDQSKFGGALNNRLVLNYEPKIYELSKFFNIIYGSVDQNTDSLITVKNHHPLLYDNSDSNDLRRVLTNNVFLRRLERELIQITSNKFRTIEDIFSGKTAQSEVLAFRIEKIDTISEEVIQNFYIFNDQETEYLDFLDTQVVYKKRYTYRIYAINYVIGNEYEYIHDSDPLTINEIRDMTNPEYNFSMVNKIKSYIIETPYFEQNTIMLDKPPLFPEYDIIPFAGSSTKIAFRLTPNYGKLKEKPIQILNSDQSIIRDMILAQDEFSEEVEYVGDTLPTKYQVLFTKEPPINYLSFSTAKSVIVDSNGNSGYIELDLEPNTKYYLTFRAIDNAGISNPGLVYCLNLNAYVDGTYVEFEEYDLLQEALDQPIVFDKVIKIEPSQNQMSIDFEGANQQGFYLQAPHIENLSLGLNENERLWMRRFKFRLVSQNTNKAIDLNVRFKYNKIIPFRVTLPPSAEIQDLNLDLSLLERTAGPDLDLSDDFYNNVSEASAEVLQRAQQQDAAIGVGGGTSGTSGTGGTGGNSSY